MELTARLWRLTNVKGRFSAAFDWLRSADSVEKVGHGFHGRKVRA